MTDGRRTIGDSIDRFSNSPVGQRPSYGAVKHGLDRTEGNILYPLIRTHEPHVYRLVDKPHSQVSENTPQTIKTSTIDTKNGAYRKGLFAIVVAGHSRNNNIGRQACQPALIAGA